MKKLVFASILALSNIAFAEGDPTEFLYQAVNGQKFIQGNLSYLSGSVDGIGGGEIDLKDLDLSGSYEQGLSDYLAVYGSIGFGQGEIDNTDINGLNPINLGAKYRIKAGIGQVYVQGNLGLGLLEKADENRTDGSINLTTRVGYIMTYSTAMAGLVLDLGLFSTDGENDNSGTDIEKTNGIALTGFYEMVVKEDVILGYSATYADKVGFGGPFTRGPLGGVVGIDGLETSMIDLGVYTRVPMSEKMQILGKVNYTMLMENEDAGVDGGNNLGVSAGIRYML